MNLLGLPLEPFELGPEILDQGPVAFELLELFAMGLLLGPNLDERRIVRVGPKPLAGKRQSIGSPGSNWGKRAGVAEVSSVSALGRLLTNLA